MAKLVELGANIETKGNFGETPLNIATVFNNVEAIAKLIELGAWLLDFTSSA